MSGYLVRSKSAQRRPGGEAARGGVTGARPVSQRLADLAVSASESPVASQLAALQRKAGAGVAQRVAAGVVQREFTSAGSLTTHFGKHGGEFGAADEGTYESESETHLANKGSFQSKVSGGKTYVYDSGSDTLGIYNGSGQTISFFKPGRGNSAKGQVYYDKQ